MVTRRAATRRKSSTAQKDAAKDINPWNHTWLDEVCAVLCAAIAIFLAVSFLSHVDALRDPALWSEALWSEALWSEPDTWADGWQADDIRKRENLMGPIGHYCGTILWGLMGWCGLVPTITFAWLARVCWRLGLSGGPEEKELGWRRSLLSYFRKSIGFLGVLVAACIMGAVLWGRDGGGSIGQLIALPLARSFNQLGAALIAGSFLLLSLAMSTNLSVLEVSKRLVQGGLVALGVTVRIPLLIASGLWWLLGVCVVGMRALARFAGIGELLERQPRMQRQDEDEESLPQPRMRRNSINEIPSDSLSGRRSKRTPDEPPVHSDSDEGDPITAQEEMRSEDEVAEMPSDAQSDQDQSNEAMTHVVVSRKNRGEKVAAREFVRTLPLPTPASASAASSEESLVPIEEPDPFARYEPPPLSLLTRAEATAIEEDDEELLEKSRLIEAKLKDFAVYGKVTQVHPGPVITLFEFEPAPGVKVGRIAALQDDLAMSLRASSIRIIAPIPKRGTVGIEVPNKHRDLVRLREVLESDQFVNEESVLSVCIGKDTYGEPVVVDIASMPHLLMAGATGTGKSVCINALLLSLLYRAHPSELGLILIDPKILELSLYESIPHLRVPVVSNPRQAKAVLQWAVDEMHRRYRLMQKYKVRNIDGYNKLVRGEKDADHSASLDDQVVMLTEEAVVEEGTVERSDTESSSTTRETSRGMPTEELKILPKLVIVIDELADLMLAAGREIEELITRLAQKARASGIHLIVATQRPSVDVITGLIKANFPARLSFRVASRVDSRTILDSMGAERLLGRGDMLLMLPGAEAVRRVHGAFVSDNEVKRVVTHIKQTAEPRYDERIIRVCERALEEENEERGAQGSTGGAEEYDEMYDKAVELVLEKGQASTSMIQRVFRIGYNRAARIIETMEKDGIVGPMDGAKPREVLLPRAEDPVG